MNGHPAPPPGRPAAEGWAPGEVLFVGAVTLAGGASGIVWAGAALAALLSGKHLDASLGEALQAAVRLPRHLSNPAVAWPAPTGGALPGPWLYWFSQTVVLTVVAVSSVLGWRLFRPSKPRDG